MLGKVGSALPRTYRADPVVDVDMRGPSQIGTGEHRHREVGVSGSEPLAHAGNGEVDRRQNRQDRNTAWIREQPDLCAHLDVAGAAHARGLIGLVQEAIGAEPSFEPLEQPDPERQRRTKALLRSERCVLRTGLHLQKPDIDDGGAVGRFEGPT